MPASELPEGEESETRWQLDASLFTDPSEGIVANGAHYLSTMQAFERAKERGGHWLKKDAFRSWAKRNPEALLQQYGLRKLENESRNNTAASYFDERYRVNWITDAD
jgi:hypothetical protein